MKPLTLSDLHTRQAWPLNQKIDHTVGAIEAFVNYCKEHGRAPYASFSGGLNSTVLLDLARRYVDPNMPGVFCSTGNEYPEIVRFVRHTKNVTIIRPTMTPREVMARYGFPLVSKEQAHAMRDIQTSKSEKLRNYRLYGDGIRTCGILGPPLAVSDNGTIHDFGKVLRTAQKAPVCKIQSFDTKPTDGGYNGRRK